MELDYLVVWNTDKLSWSLLLTVSLPIWSVVTLMVEEFSKATSLGEQCTEGICGH